MSDIQLTVIIPAAGRGARFGGDKLSEELGGRPVLLRTVEFFAKRDDVHQIIVAGPAESDGHVDAAFESRFGPALSFLGVKTVTGGAERTDSVRAALHALDESCTHVAVHDAARPLIDDALMDRMVEAAAKTPAVIPGVLVRDTLKRVSSESRDLGESADEIIDDILGDAGRVSADARAVEATVDRDQLVAIQTPQCFARDTLVQAYAQESLPQTDDAGILEAQGIEVLVVEGDPSNLKITTREDLVVAEALLKVRKPKPSF